MSEHLKTNQADIEHILAAKLNFLNVIVVHVFA